MTDIEVAPDLYDVEGRPLLQAVVDNAPFGAHLYELEPDGRLVFNGYNRKAEELLGLDHARYVGLALEEAFPGNAGTEVARACKRVARDGGSWEADDCSYDVDGITGSFELHALSFGPNRVAVFFRDIAEKRRLEIALRESESRLERATTDAPFPMMIHAEDGEVVAINRAWEEIAGYSIEDIPTIAEWTERAYGDRAEQMQLDISGLYSLTRSTEEGESAVRTAAGDVRVWDFCSGPLGTLPDGRRLVITTARDVTERRLAEQELGRITRALLTLTCCNEVLLHARSEDDLLVGVCRSAVEQGTYRMAWVGYAEDDEARSIRPIAFAGVENGYLTEMSFSWGERAADGPCGLAIRDRRPVLVRDTEKDTRFPCIRDAALARGYRSIAALPLYDPAGEAFGIFVFMAAEPDAFDVDELELLKELAADLAFGLEARRSEERRCAAERDLAVAKERLEALLMSLTETIGRVVEARDLYTHGHEQRTAAIAVALAEHMGLPKDIVEATRIASLVHDIGKMGIPVEILAKPGELSPYEFAMIQQHPSAGYSILKDIPFEWPVAQIVLQHHERMDGSGYPDGLVGDEILMEARILAVADVLEAMACSRPYRPARGADEAIAEITGSSGKYDPDVVAACRDLRQAGLLDVLDDAAGSLGMPHSM